LIFLDLYDNHIEDMNGLSALKSLRVLMLGKNRIKRVTGLETLVKLDVLDLHGNQIKTVENLSHLCELRVLNLAGNQIENVSNLAGMDTLAELNLRRNVIATIQQVDALPSLQRLFLSFNNISRWDDVECLGEAAALCEISLDGNPITQEVTYKQVVLKNMPQLRQLDMKRITEDERRVAAVQLRKEEERKDGQEQEVRPEGDKETSIVEHKDKAWAIFDRAPDTWKQIPRAQVLEPGGPLRPLTRQEFAAGAARASRRPLGPPARHSADIVECGRRKHPVHKDGFLAAEPLRTAQVSTAMTTCSS